jgi:Uma2 family endonuclease
MTAKLPEMGPFRADQLRPGDRYELDNGHPVYCAPAGGSHATPNLLGAAAVATDPKVKEAGVDAGFAPKPHLLRAPAVAVGNVPNAPGWVEGAPDLAIEYADVGQDEAELEHKIRDLFAAGMKYLWVVRLTGPRRVEVHERGQTVRTVYPGTHLTAPGVLQNPVLVEALYDRDAAERATLTNLLQRKGYQDLDAVLAKGREEGLRAGRAEGLRVARAAVGDLCEVLHIPLTPERQAALAEMDVAELDALRERLKRERRWD